MGKARPEHVPRQATPGRYRAWRARRRERLAARSRLRRRLTRFGIALVALVVVLAGGGAGYYLYETGRITHVQIRGITRARGPVQNILLIGSTDRCAARSIAVFRQECASGVTGINSDVVLVAHVDPRRGTVSLLSIPRDTFVPGARSGSALCGTTSALTPGTCSDKIDAALVEGPGQLIAAIQQDFGIPINHFVDLSFATFTNVVNALGGVRMDFPDRLYDDETPPLKITRTGCQLLKGTEALALVRSRHLYYFTGSEQPNYAAIQAGDVAASGGSYDGTGDLGRITRVHLFLKALAAQVAARGLGNPFTDNNLINAVAPNLTVDSGLSTSDLFHLALDLRHADFATASELTIPTVVDTQPYTYDGGNYGDVIFPSEPQDQKVIDAFLGTAPRKVAPGSIRVSVVDGSGSPVATSTVASGLAGLGYRVVPTTASDDVGPVAETTVLYAKGHRAQAEQVLGSLSGTVVLGQGSPDAGAEVSVVVGSDVAVARPASTTPSSSSTGSTSPTTTPALPASSSGDLSAPTAANPAIPSWDPRSCSHTS